MPKIHPRVTPMQGGEFYGQATTAFHNGQYRDALRLANHAAVESPRNPRAHELISQAMFAVGDYRGAAFEAHAALNFGPPATWEELYTYYGDKAPYTNQLRASGKILARKPDGLRRTLPASLSILDDGAQSRSGRAVARRGEAHTERYSRGRFAEEIQRNGPSVLSNSICRLPRRCRQAIPPTLPSPPNPSPRGGGPRPVDQGCVDS